MNLDEVDTPALLLDLDAFERNLDEFAFRVGFAHLAFHLDGNFHKNVTDCPSRRFRIKRVDETEPILETRKRSDVSLAKFSQTACAAEKWRYFCRHGL